MSYFNSLALKDDPHTDAFSRLRVSEFASLANIKQTFNESPLFINTELGGTGTSTHDAALVHTTLAVTTSADFVVRQTYERYVYQSGKSQIIYMTCSDFAPQTNVTKRLGYFSSSTVSPYTASLDGLFLESSGGTVSINIYRSGTLISSVAQADWNIDPLDGTGTSSVNIDWDTLQLICIDFQWLGAGRVRWMLDVNGILYPFHYSNHANSASDVYMLSPNQPLRWEIRSAASAGSFNMICGAVGSEDHTDSVGMTFSRDTGTTQLDADVVGTVYAMIGLRLGSTYVNTGINFLSTSIYCSTLDDVRWSIILNPTVAGTFTYSAITNSSLESAIGVTTNTITGGTVLASGYARQQTAVEILLNISRKLGVSIAGVSDTIVLCITPLGASADVYGSINWKEVI